MQVPRLVKVTLNMGIGDAKQSTPILEAATEQLATIAGQRPSVRRARKSVANFKLRDGMPVGRRGDAPRRPHVGVRRPPGLDRDPAHPRLPRPQPAVVRRARQLLDGHPRAADLPRDRLRLDRRGARPGRDDHDLGRRTDEEGFELLLGLGFPFAQEGRPGQVDRAAEEEEERRHEEARLRAEAEAAALEQLKEENPEAYAKPVREEEEGEEGEEGEGAAEDSGGRRFRAESEGNE